jgi:hypothetical protein
MTYSSGSLIQAQDYNGFISNGQGVGPGYINDIWSRHDGGVTDCGWGENGLAVVSTGGTITATNWASMVNTLASMGSQTGTTLTSRTAPTAGNTINILANVQADINSCYTNRGNAVGAGTEYGTFTGTTSKTTTTGTGTAAWTITFTHVVTFPSANQARYFWNAGGRVRLQYGKSSTGLDSDPDWNTFIGQVGSIYIAGRVASAAQTIAGTSYTGTNRIGGTGGTQTTLATTTGWYSLTAGAAATTVLQLNDASAPYTGDTIITTLAKNAGATTLTLTTTFNSTARSGAGQNTQISGGTAVSSPATTIGAATAPTVLCTYIPPSTTYLTQAGWGTPSITASVA